MICGKKFRAIFLSFSAISRNIQTKHTSTQLESSGLGFLRFRYVKTSYSEKAAAYCILSGNKQSYWRRNLDVGGTSLRKEGEITQWLVRLLTSLYWVSSWNKGCGDRDTQHAYEKRKRHTKHIKIKKNKINLYRNAVETSRLKTAFLRMVRNIRMPHTVVKLSTWRTNFCNNIPYRLYDYYCYRLPSMQVRI